MRYGVPIFIRGGGRQRGGLTLMELLVVISLIGMLMALSLPALQQARETSRRAACANNLRNIGLALSNCDGARGRLPAAGNFSFEGVAYHNWVVDVLPYLERTDLFRRWRFDKQASISTNVAISRHQIAVLVCPDDDTTVRGEGNLSYVVNGGFGWTQPVDCPAAMHFSMQNNVQTLAFDLNGNGITCPKKLGQDGSPSDKDLFFLSGLFFVENWPLGSFTVRHRSLDQVSDGLSRTLMATENLRAGFDPATGATWASPLPWHVCFFVSSYVCKDATCTAKNVDWTKANARGTRESINPSGAAPEGDAPWPSSNHPGGVNAIYCDGHVKFLSDDVDGSVYGTLVTPEGNRMLGTMRQRVAGDLAE